MGRKNVSFVGAFVAKESIRKIVIMLLFRGAIFGVPVTFGRHFNFADRFISKLTGPPFKVNETLYLGFTSASDSVSYSCQWADADVAGGVAVSQFLLALLR